MKMYEVGGCVRDEILGVPSKDIDFTVVLDTNDRSDALKSDMPVDPFDFMVESLKRQGFTIFVETPEFLTARGKFPKDRPSQIPTKYAGMAADFVLSRKEGNYEDGRRPTDVMPGTLEDDLARRDFTMNAIAKATDGSLIDPFNGQADIRRRVIKAVGDPVERLSEDALRAVRAMRFSVTKQFDIERSLVDAMESAEVLNAIVDKISDERIQQELSKMMRFNSLAGIFTMARFPALTSAMLARNVSLDATMKTKGRNK